MPDVTRFVTEVTPTLDTSQYAANDRLGSVMSIAPGIGDSRPVYNLTGIQLVDQVSTTGLSIDILLFDASPTVASADNAAIDISDAEMIDKCVGHVNIPTTAYSNLANNCTGIRENLNIKIKPASGATFYALLVLRSGTPTYAAGSIVLRFSYETAL